MLTIKDIINKLMKRADFMNRRCDWAGTDPLYITYHDEEWGVPLHDDGKHFEFLLLESAQAGLSWITILKKRETYRKAFANFDPVQVALFDQDRIKELLDNPGIIRNRRKIEGAVQNAQAFLKVKNEFGSFDRYIWQFVGGTSIINTWRSIQEIPNKTRESEEMSKDLKKRGFTFVGPTICYAYMQAVGMVNDHIIDCFRHSEICSMETER